MGTFWQDDDPAPANKFDPTLPPGTWGGPPLPPPTYPTPREPYDVANPRINADPTFNAQLQRLLQHSDFVSEDRIRRQAGQLISLDINANPDGDICETVMGCFCALLPFGMNEPKGLRDRVEGKAVSVAMKARLDKKQQDEAFKGAWVQYLQACSERKIRIAEAKSVEQQKLTIANLEYAQALRTLEEAHAAKLKAIRDERKAAETEPAPTMPKREQFAVAQSPA